MSQAHLIANLDRKEFLLPRSVGAFEGQLCSLDWSMTATGVLLAASNGEGTGDIATARDEDPTLFAAISGRWAGERVAIIGDYWRGSGDVDDRHLAIDTAEDLGDGRRLYEVIKAQEDGWADISEYVVELLEHDDHLREVRNEVQTAPSSATFTDAAGFDHEGVSAAPRSILDRESGEITAIFVPEIDPLGEPTEAEPLTDEGQLAELRDILLADARNLLGPWDEGLIERLMPAVTHPNRLTWAEAQSLIVAEGMTTVWAAVCKVDPSFPKSASMDPMTKATLWERIPSGPLIFKAVKSLLTED